MFETLANLKKFSFKTKNEAKRLEETQNRLKLYCDNAIQSCTKLFPNNDDDYGFDFVVKMFKFLFPNNYVNLIKDNTVVRTKTFQKRKRKQYSVFLAKFTSDTLTGDVQVDV